MELEPYRSKSAREAKEANYGGKSYWDYLESHALELHSYFLRKGDTETAQQMLDQSLSEALAGNNGD